MSGNTGLHCLGCLFSKHGSFTSLPRRTSSGVVFAVREGQSEKDGYLPPAWAISAPPICPIQPSLAGIPLRYLSYVVAARANLSMERAPATETEAVGTQKTAYVTDIVTLPDTVDPGGFKWRRSLTLAQRQPRQGRAIAYSD